MLPSALTFLDIETTGASLYKSKIVEIAAIRVENGKVVRELNTLINPLTAIPPEIESFNGITNSLVEGKPTFEQIADELLDILKDSYLIAHNVGFDYAFLKKEFKQMGINFRQKNFCTVKLSRALYGRYRRHNLDAIIERFNLKCEDRHRAYGDTKAIYEFFMHAVSQFGDEKIEKILTQITKNTALPNNLDKSQIDKLPETPGVYIFYGENDLPIYIGKSKNIKTRVLSHFYDSGNSQKEQQIFQQVKHIETIEKAGELGALLLESKLVKEMLPLYNSKLRLKQNMVYLSRVQDKDGYYRPEIIESENFDINEIDKIYGVFKSKKQCTDYLTAVCEDKLLCKKLLNIEKTNSSCFRHRLELCKGACVGKEPSLFYNMRFDQAFADMKLARWPFPSPVAITEADIISGKSETFIFDKWCCLGNIEVKDEAEEERNINEGYAFDYDLYKILNLYLKQHNLKNIKLLPSYSYNDLTTL